MSKTVMRNYTSKLSMKKLVYAIALFAIVVAGCKKDDKDETPKFSNIMFVNAIPDAGPLDFYIDRKKMGSGGIAFGSGTEYYQVNAGSHEIGFYDVNSQLGEVKFSQGFNADQSYSVYAINTTANRQSLVLTDTLPTPPAGKAWVRYVNLTNNPKAFIERTGGVFEFKAQPFKGASGYKAYDAGSIDFVVKDPDAGQIADPDPINFQGGKVYTLALYGASPNFTVTAFSKP